MQLPEPRALWWAAGGLIDALASGANGDAEWLAAAKVLCNRIDFQIRDLAAGGAKSGDALLREMLYTIARREASTPRLKEIKQLYQLDSLFPRAEQPVVQLEMDVERLEAALFDMHSRLDALKRRLGAVRRRRSRQGAACSASASPTSRARPRTSATST